MVASIASRIITEHTNKRTRDQLIAVVKERGATVLADIRLSTRYPLDGRFKPDVLEASLKKEGIRYMRLKDLGNKFKDMRPMEESRRCYLEHAVKQDGYATLVELLSSGDDVICLICYCEPPKPCHRKWLQTSLLARLNPGH